jgi:hypothetical protein
MDTLHDYCGHTVVIFCQDLLEVCDRAVAQGLTSAGVRVPQVLVEDAIV